MTVASIQARPINGVHLQLLITFAYLKQVFNDK
jgi:hypothetical protein